jgi:3-hydroxyisobutyrate dehydrogenase-like beta-hydroxyacid dehydrogenase
MKPTLGFIGLGLMGAPIAAHLVNAGYTVHVFNRTKEKASELLKSGAVWKDSPSEVAKNSEIVFTMVTNDAALRELTAFIQPNLPPNGIHVDCSTVAPSLTKEIEAEYSQKGKFFLHSPVLGGVQ